MSHFKKRNEKKPSKNNGRFLNSKKELFSSFLRICQSFCTSFFNRNKFAFNMFSHIWMIVETFKFFSLVHIERIHLNVPTFFPWFERDKFELLTFSFCHKNKLERARKHVDYTKEYYFANFYCILRPSFNIISWTLWAARHHSAADIIVCLNFAEPVVTSPAA